MSPTVTYTTAFGDVRRIPHADPRNADAQANRLREILEPCVAATVRVIPDEAPVDRCQHTLDLFDAVSTAAGEDGA